MEAMRAMMARLKLTVNEEDRALPDTAGALRLSGLHLRAVLFDADGTGLYWHAPVEEEYPEGMPTHQRNDQDVRLLNRVLVVWANYFSLGPVSNAYRAVDRHASERLRRWLRKKHKQPGQGTHASPTSTSIMF